MKEVREDNSIIKRINDNNPVYKMNEKEFNHSLLKFGSFVSILKNKRINQTMLLALVLEYPEYQESFKGVSEIDNIRVIIYNLILRFPILCKSKIIKNKIKELLNDGTRKTVL